MPGLSDYAEKKTLDHLLGKTAYTMPTGNFLALFTADPTDTGSTANEISTTSTGYARQAITSVMTATDATSGQSTNSSAISFPQATAAWGSITWLAIFDAATGGNMLFSGAATTPKQIDSGDIYQIAVGQLSVTLS